MALGSLGQSGHRTSVHLKRKSNDGWKGRHISPNQAAEKKSNDGWKWQHISTNEAAKMIVLGLFQLNPGLANTVGALRRKPHVEKVYRDLAANQF